MLTAIDCGLLGAIVRNAVSRLWYRVKSLFTYSIHEKLENNCLSIASQLNNRSTEGHNSLYVVEVNVCDFAELEHLRYEYKGA